MRRIAKATDEWSILIKSAHKRIARLSCEPSSIDPWEKTLTSNLKSIWTLNKYHSSKQKGEEARRYVSWEEFTSYWYTRLHAMKRRQFLKDCTNDDDSWDLVLRQNFSNITGWYRRRGLQIELTAHKYTRLDEEWRSFFEYWSRALGECEKRNDGWNRLLHSVVVGLANREKAKIRPNNQLLKTLTWNQILKQSRTKLFIAESRQERSWETRISNAQNYLAFFERKKYGKEKC